MVGMGAREVVGSGNGSDDSAASLRTEGGVMMTVSARCAVTVRGTATSLGADNRELLAVCCHMALSRRSCRPEAANASAAPFDPAAAPRRSLPGPFEALVLLATKEFEIGPKSCSCTPPAPPAASEARTASSREFTYMVLLLLLTAASMPLKASCRGVPVPLLLLAVLRFRLAA